MILDQDTFSSGPDKATERLLSVFEAIAQHGPLTLAALTEATDLPRSAVHRAAQVLQRRGWVRARLSDHAYAVSSRFDDAIANARYAQEEAEALAPLMARLAKDWGGQVDIGLFVARGVFEVVDSTARRIRLGRRSLVVSPIAVAAQVSLPPAGRVRHLDAFLMQATDDEAEFVTSGQHFRQVKNAETTIMETGGLSLEGEEVLTPFSAPSGVAGALRMRRMADADGAMAAMRAGLDAVMYGVAAETDINAGR